MDGIVLACRCLVFFCRYFSYQILRGLLYLHSWGHLEWSERSFAIIIEQVQNGKKCERDEWMNRQPAHPRLV